MLSSTSRHFHHGLLLSDKRARRFPGIVNCGIVGGTRAAFGAALSWVAQRLDGGLHRAPLTAAHEAMHPLERLDSLTPAQLHIHVSDGQLFLRTHVTQRPQRHVPPSIPAA